MSLNKYCCEDIGTHTPSCGNEILRGGFGALAVLDPDHEITDYSDAAEWRAEIAAGRVVIINEIQGEFPEVSEIESDSLNGCGSETDLDGFDQTFVWQDKAVKQSNNEVYEALNGCQKYLVVFDCQPSGTDKLKVIDENLVSFVCKPPIGETSKKTKQRYMCTAKWSSEPDQFPEIVDAPDGIFNV